MRAVSGKLVEIWDPSSEGPWIIENLKQAGFDVRSIALADVVLTRADLVVMAGDAEGALGALKLLRDDGLNGDVPVVLLGVPDGLVHEGEGPAFAADAVIARPVVLESVLRVVRRLIARDEEISHVQAPKPENTMRLAGEEPDSSQVFIVRSSPREPTLDLEEDEEEDTPASIARARSSVSAKRTATSTRTGSIVDRTPEPVLPPEARADVSPWLDELLKAADRRVFPDLPSLLLHLPAADEPAESLVPPELFEAPSLRIDEPVHEDPIDAFTYVGGPAVPPPSLAPPESSAPRTPPTAMPDLVTTAPGSESVVPIAPVLAAPKTARKSEPEPERGTLGRGAIMRVLARIARREGDALVEIAGDVSAQLTFAAGEIAALEGDVALSALAALRRRGRATEAPADELGAIDVLRRRVEQQLLSAFERDRLLREAREELLVRVLAAEKLSFVVAPVDRAAVRTRPLQKPFFASLIEAARSAFDEDVRLFIPPASGIALGKDRERGLAPFELPAEIVELLVSMEGRTLGELAAAAPTEPGLAGALACLVACDALVLVEAPRDGRSPEASAAARALLDAAARLAEDGDYFALLGVERSVEDVELARAHRARKDELAALPLSLLGLGSLADARDGAIDAVDEAFRALCDRARRGAYAAALSR